MLLSRAYPRRDPVPGPPQAGTPKKPYSPTPPMQACDSSPAPDVRVVQPCESSYLQCPKCHQVVARRKLIRSGDLILTCDGNVETATGGHGRCGQAMHILVHSEGIAFVLALTTEEAHDFLEHPVAPLRLYEELGAIIRLRPDRARGGNSGGNSGASTSSSSASSPAPAAGRPQLPRRRVLRPGARPAQQRAAA
jgi:hypothetical protein